MHRFTIATLILAFASALVPTVAEAQASAHNTVTVHIPTVLRLRIDATSSSDTQLINVQIVNGQVDPGSLDVQVFANTAWLLTVEDRGGDGPSLQYQRSGSGPWLAPANHPQVASGGPTGGWQSVPLAFRADPSEALANPNGRRALLFTLTRP